MDCEEYKKAKQNGHNVYNKAKKNGVTTKDRWGEGIGHHPKLLELMTFLAEHDFNDCGDSFCWDVGGDGDNGESLMYEMDAYFEQKDLDKNEKI